jgi:hypothetical protein
MMIRKRTQHEVNMKNIESVLMLERAKQSKSGVAVNNLRNITMAR